MLETIHNAKDFADYLGVSEKTVNFFAYTRKGQAQAYKSFALQKRSGGSRILKAPHPALRTVQRAILKKILTAEHLAPRACVYSYLPNKSAKDMAARHVNKEAVIRIDLQDFFQRINFGRVLGALKSFPLHLPHNVAVLIARLCTHENALPQGAPTSPALSNLICRRMDSEIIAFAKKFEFHYSRYSDDIVFSAYTRRRLKLLVEREEINYSYVSSEPIRSIIKNNGFDINESKTRVSFRRNKQMVVGAVCNKKVNVDRRYVRRIRTLIHLCEKSPASALSAYSKWTKKNRKDIHSVLRGMIEHIRLYKGENDKVFRNLAIRYNALCLPNKKINLLRVEKIQKERFNEKHVFVCVSKHKNYGLPQKEYGDNAVYYKTGSCFLIKDLGVVTSYHNLFHHFEVFNANRPEFRITLDSLVYANAQLDIAILAPGDMLSFKGLFKFVRAEEFDELSRESAVTVLGYPKYTEGDSLSFKRGYVTQIRNVFDMKLYALDTHILEGESGGAVINDDGKVVGLIRSYNGETLAVPISYAFNESKPSPFKLGELDGKFIDFGAEPPKDNFLKKLVRSVFRNVKIALPD